MNLFRIAYTTVIASLVTLPTVAALTIIANG